MYNLSMTMRYQDNIQALVTRCNGNDSDSNNGESDTEDNNKEGEPKKKLPKKMIVEPTTSNNEDNDRKDDKGGEKYKDEDGATIPPLVWRIVPNNESDSDSDSNGEGKEERDDIDQTVIEPMKMTPSFLSK